MIRAPVLTDEQRAVVEHGSGPAVVIAVPGAGKTTALVHRIRHLVTERRVAPARILACSFNRSTVQDLSSALQSVGIQGVDVRTLHSLGYALLRRANAAPDSPDAGPDAAAHRLARHVLRSRASERDQDRSDLDISAPDLVDQIAAWKQQLAYPDLEDTTLPPNARDVARTADHENDAYLDLYRRFEARRRQTGLLTYPDMLRKGWETLVQNDELRAHAQQAYDHVMVDEFQDVSRAQFQILDLLTAPHRNYMAIGDDDQCIYGWRGASPSYLRSFADRYDAAIYQLETTFRLPAAPVTLANALIQHNETRHTKQIHLSRGFCGRAQFFRANDAKAEATHVIDRIQQLRSDDAVSLDEIAILVRTYGQTPPFEQALLDHNLPYSLHGHSPFYRRREVQTLLRYLYWTVLERRRRANGWFQRPEQAEQYIDRYARILNDPNRYVARERIDRIRQEALNRQESVLDVTARHASKMHDRTTARVESFLETAEELVSRVNEPAAETLKWLIDAIEYEDALREQSANPAQGSARVQTVRALVRYARPHETAHALLNDIRSLAADERPSDDPSPAIDIRSIHRAKGLEWPIVFLPGCTEGTLPLEPDGAAPKDLAEERRLFYVAITRAWEHLYVSTNTSESPSRFLDEAEVDTRLSLCRSVRDALDAPPTALSNEQIADLCRGIVELGLSRYVRREWAPEPSYAKTLRSRLEGFSSAVTDAEERCETYRRAQEAHEKEKKEVLTTVQDRIEEVREILGDTTVPASHDTPKLQYPDDALFRFEWTSEESKLAVYWDETRVATLDPFDVGPLDVRTVMSLPWPHLIGRPASPSGRNSLRLRVDWSATESEWTAAEIQSLTSPSPPSDKTRLFASEAVSTGLRLFRHRLASGLDRGTNAPDH